MKRNDTFDLSNDVVVEWVGRIAGEGAEPRWVGVCVPPASRGTWVTFPLSIL